MLALSARGSAATTISSGTKILCILKHAINSTTAMAGNDFSLLVDDPAQPALKGASVHGSITDVGRAAGTARARIGFILSYIKFANGTRAAIHANVVGKDVVQSNTALARQEAVKFSLPPMPGTVTPGPVIWQIHFRQGSAPSVSPPPAGNTSGYVYAEKSNENIVIPPGSPVTIQLTSSLTAP
ncbi:MAG: hypothetical protein JO092_06300 [Candidatus Eremiobacteraeota bacterium]|nr:hypothetical protein [Candidatus Eremiobacteraeota bacterium]